MYLDKNLFLEQLSEKVEFWSIEDVNMCRNSKHGFLN